MDFPLMIEDIIKSEGGKVDHPSDRGGRTNFGITQTSWDEYRQRHPDLECVDVFDLTQELASSFYSERYFKKKIDWLPSLLRHPVFDFEVNAGKYAIRTLQYTINDLLVNLDRVSGDILTVDGFIGEKTVLESAYVIRSMIPSYVVDRFVLDRIHYYKVQVDNNPKQNVFLKGWINRSEKFFSWK